jgi:peptidyl-dipeptidase Dcp
VLTFADSRPLREKVYKAFVNRGDNGGASDTNQTIAEITRIRAERAKLLGYPTHAHWRMQDTMAKTPERAMDLMNRVWPAAVARVKEEVRDQQAVARKLGHNITIEPWDYRYYMEKIRRRAVQSQPGRAQALFRAEQHDRRHVLHGRAALRAEVPRDHRPGAGLAPGREGLPRHQHGRRGRGRLLHGQLCPQRQALGRLGDHLPVALGLLGDDIVLGSNNNNFAKPEAGQPALISLDDARTLFHEFGHAIHYFLSDVRYPSLGGTPRDFVEYPSQVHENWVLTPEILNRFAKHHQTGQPMPKALVDKIQASSTFNQGFATVEYLSSALVDMAMHNRPGRRGRSRRVRARDADPLGMPQGDGDAAPPAAVQSPLLQRRLFGRLLFLPLVGDDGRRHLGAFQETGNVWDPATARSSPTSALHRQRRRPRRRLPRLPRPRPRRQRLLRKRGFPTGGGQ